MHSSEWPVLHPEAGETFSSELEGKGTILRSIRASLLKCSKTPVRP